MALTDANVKLVTINAGSFHITLTINQSNPPIKYNNGPKGLMFNDVNAVATIRTAVANHFNLVSKAFIYTYVIGKIIEAKH